MTPADNQRQAPSESSCHRYKQGKQPSVHMLTQPQHTWTVTHATTTCNVGHNISLSPVFPPGPALPETTTRLHGSIPAGDKQTICPPQVPCLQPSPGATLPRCVQPLHGLQNIPVVSHSQHRLTLSQPLPRHLQIDSALYDSDDSITNDFQHASPNHKSNLTFNGIQYTEPINTPILNQIKRSICKDIWRNKFIDFSSLLPSFPSSTCDPQFSFQLDQHSNFALRPSTRTQKIITIESWTSAFIKFTAVYTTKFPHEAAQLMKYAEIVRDIAARCPGLAFYHYDIHFRRLRESVPLPWDRLHTEFWLRACTSFHQQPTPFSPPHHTSFHSSHSHRIHRFHDKTCWNFNKRTLCRNAKCPHPHICGFCRGSHAAYHCKFSSKRDTVKLP
ncbi:uncharacterized protein LOC128229306 [Mya arenaria]|uniref:uncharacterized protein LOC128229306 n=1 Tax=Mya arenaria TaxID=6604 RepID=UPI0022E78E45|nr:uncharacterized protein LOC128229306 [Mya arenaria]